MKKITGTLVFLVFLLFFSMPVIADTVTNKDDEAGSPIELEQNTVIAFSPGVRGEYNFVAPEQGQTIQWYSAGTYHNGGKLFYGTSAEQTTIWKKTRSAGETFAAADIPKALEDEEGNIIPWGKAEEDLEEGEVTWYR